MAAGPYVTTLILRGSKTNEVINLPITLSDVNGAFATFQDGADFLQLRTDQNWAFVDWIVSGGTSGTGPTDTSSVDVFKNQQTTTLRIVPKANLATANQRQFTGNPVGFQGGAVLKFKQNT